MFLSIENKIKSETTLKLKSNDQKWVFFPDLKVVVDKKIIGVMRKLLQL